MGVVVPLFGASNGGERQKNREMGWALGVDGRRLKILHTTTNQKQAPITEESKERRGDHRGSAGGCKSIVLGAIAVK